MNNKNNFICIGAVHPDYIISLKGNHFKNRTNPINQDENLGGVAYNNAKILSFLDQNTKLYSLNCSIIQKKKIKLQGIKFRPLDKNLRLRYYTSILDKNGKMILGLANMDSYEKLSYYNSSIFKNHINKNIILDLNLPAKLIKQIVNLYSKKNYICICGTSAHKVYKIKTLLKKIDTIILNKQESLTLTNQKTIKESIKFLINKNKKLNIIITNGKNSVNAYMNNKIYVSYPLPIKIKNENGAGDALSAIFNFFYCFSFNHLDSLNKGICGGLLNASGYKSNSQKYLKKIDTLSKLIKYKVSK